VQSNYYVFAEIIHKENKRKFLPRGTNYPKVLIIRTHNNVHAKKSFQNFFLLKYTVNFFLFNAI
jgi:hypothetical protein